MNIGLYFGTFNPIHIGHLILANHIAEYTNLDQVWLVVTPHNPFKQKSSLLNDYLRLEMVQIAIENYPKLKASDIEFKLPQPNYTVNTLSYLEEKYPQNNFSLIMGEDNLESLNKWKNYEVLLERYQIFVYPRVYDNKQESEFLKHPNVLKIDAPIVELSSTFIRDAIRNKKNVKPLLPDKVWEHIDKNLYYL